MATTEPTTAAAPLPRPRTLVVGTAFAAGASAMVFAGLFGWYLHLRSETLTGGDAWLKPGTISLVPGGMMMVTFAMSVVTMAWATHAIRRDDRPHGYLALGLTLLFGIANINQQVFYWKDMQLQVGRSAAELMILTITGAHLVMLLAAIGFVGLMTFRAMAGQYSSRQADGIQAAALFWYVMVAVYTAIYYGIYITK